MTASKLSRAFSLNDLPPVTEKVLEGPDRSDIEISADDEISDSPADPPQEEIPGSQGEDIEHTAAVDDYADGADAANSDNKDISMEESEDEKEKKTSREILGLFDAV